MTTQSQENAIKTRVNLYNYDSANIGDRVFTTLGTFVVKSKPNLYQPVNARFWEFQHEILGYEVRIAA